MKINKNITSLTAWNLGFLSIAIGLYFWSYWSGWHDSNRKCDTNWRHQFEIVEDWYSELLKESENKPQKLAILTEFSRAYRRNVSGIMYSGYNQAMPLKAFGICLCIIGLFLMLSAMANQYISVPENPSIKKKYKPFFIALTATLLISSIIWGSSFFYQKSRSATYRNHSLQRKIALNYFSLLRLQKMGAQFAPVLIVEKLRSNVGMYLFRKKEGSMLEIRTCEEAIKWLSLHKIEIPGIKKDGNAGMMKVWTPLGNKLIKINNNSNEESELEF